MSTVSHELRTPLANSVMFLENLLRKSQNDPGATRVIQIVIYQMQFMLSLVNDLLDIKMIDNGVFESNCDKFSTKDALDFVWHMFSEQLKLRKIDLSFHFLESNSLIEAYSFQYEEILLEKASLPDTLYGDVKRLKQVLINLIKNASKFTFKGGTIRVFVAFDSVKQELQVHVVDSGRGITETEMKNLFSMFGKLKRTAAQNSDGIGLGLTICKKLVEANHGYLTVKSEGENCGSAFMFTMKMSNEQKESSQMKNFLIFDSQQIVEENKRQTLEVEGKYKVQDELPSKEDEGDLVNNSACKLI